MERCPCCHARLRNALQCPRCQADLSAAISAQQAAGLWLSQAVHCYGQGKIEQCIDALMLSSALNRTELAINFRDFLIQQQCQDILALLQQKQYLAAKQQLFKIRKLFPVNELLVQLNNFADYLLSQSKPKTSWNRFLQTKTRVLSEMTCFVYLKQVGEALARYKAQVAEIFSKG